MSNNSKWTPVGVIGNKLVIQDKEANTLKHDPQGAYWGGTPQMTVELPDWVILKLADSIKAKQVCVHNVS